MIDLTPSPGALTPIFLLKVDGKPFPPERILRIDVTDEAGFESDELVLTLDDTPPQIERPRAGAKYELSLGFHEWGPPVYIGTYIFEEIERNGYERTLTLIAKAADHAETLKEPKTRAWENTTFGQTAGIIAKEHRLKLAISDALANHPIPYLAQSEESDQHLLTRLGRRIGAVIAPKDGHLLVTERRTGKTASGNWRHKVTVLEYRKIKDSPDTVFPSVLAGERACPPEDCGGPWRYPEFLEELSDPDHEEHESTKEWAGAFDPEIFSVPQAHAYVGAMYVWGLEKRGRYLKER